MRRFACLLMLACGALGAAFGKAAPKPPQPGASCAPAAKTIVGKWLATLKFPEESLRMAVEITLAKGGGYTAIAHSPDQNEMNTPVPFVSYQEGILTLAFDDDVYFEGKLAADGQSLRGQFNQGDLIPLVFQRVDQIPTAVGVKGVK